MYLSGERTDLQYVAKELGRGMSKATEDDLKRLKRAGRYVAATTAAFTRLEVDFNEVVGSTTVLGISDSDWAKDASRRSTSGGALWAYGAPVASFSRTQKCVALSSCEAELIALSLTGIEAKGLSMFLSELDEAAAVHLRCDATAAICALGRLGPGRLKHVEIRHFWLQHELRAGAVRISKIGTLDNPSDALTKVLSCSRQWTRLVMDLGVHLPWEAPR